MRSTIVLDTRRRTFSEQPARWARCICQGAFDSIKAAEGVIKARLRPTASTVALISKSSHQELMRPHRLLLLRRLLPLEPIDVDAITLGVGHGA